MLYVQDFDLILAVWNSNPWIHAKIVLELILELASNFWWNIEMDNIEIRLRHIHEDRSIQCFYRKNTRVIINVQYFW